MAKGKFQRAPIEAIQYKEPKVEKTTFIRRDDAGNFAKSEATHQAFLGDDSIKELVAFVKGAKNLLGKQVGIGKTASFGHDDYQIAVETPDGTAFLNPGDWLIRDGKTVRVVKEAAFASQFGAVK